MPEISDDEFRELQQLRSQTVSLQLDNLKAVFRAENPHVPAGVLEHWVGSPDDFKGFAESLKSTFPVPQAAAAQPGSAAPAQAAPPVAAPPTGQATEPVNPGPTTPPAMAAQFTAPMTPDAARLAQQQSLMTGNPAQTLEQMQAAQARAAQVAPGALPAPGGVDALQQQDVVETRSEEIRERMRVGLANPAEVRWLAQNGSKGFTAAMKAHGQKVLAARGRS